MLLFLNWTGVAGTFLHFPHRDQNQECGVFRLLLRLSACESMHVFKTTGFNLVFHV